MDIRQDQLDSLGSKLDAANLSDEDRAILKVAFQLANQAIAEKSDDVSGFALRQPDGTSPTISFVPKSWGSGPMQAVEVDVNVDSTNGLEYDINADLKG